MASGKMQQRSLKEIFDQEIFSNDSSSAFKGIDFEIIIILESKFEQYDFPGGGMQEDFSLTSPEHLAMSRMGANSKNGATEKPI